MIWVAVVIVVGVLIAAWKWLIDDGDGKLEPGELFFGAVLRDALGWIVKLPIWPLIAVMSLVGWLILDGVGGLPAAPLSVLQGLWNVWTWTMHGLHDVYQWLTD